MQLRSTLLCDAATVRDSLLHVLGGGINRVWRSPLPAKLGVDLALVLNLEQDEVLEPHELRIVAVDPDGTETLVAATGFQGSEPLTKLEEGELVCLPVAVPLRDVRVHTYGQYKFRVVVDDEPFDETWVWVFHPVEATLPSIR